MSNSKQTFDILITSYQIKEKIYQLKFSPSYNSFFSLSEKHLKQIGLPELNVIQDFELSTLHSNMSINPNGTTIILSGHDKTLKVYDIQKNKIIKEIQSHTDICSESLWLSQSSFLSVGYDRQAKIFDLAANKLVLTVPTFSGVSSVCRTNSPEVFILGCFDKHLRILDTRTKEASQKVNIKQKSTSLVFSDISENIVSIGRDSQYIETNMRSFIQVKNYRDSKFVVNDDFAKLSIHPDSAFICSGSNNGKVFLFSNLQNQPTILNNSHQYPVLCSAFASNLLVTGDVRGQLCFWN